MPHRGYAHPVGGFPSTAYTGGTTFGNTEWNDFLGQIRPETISGMPTQVWSGDPTGFYETDRLAQMGDYAANPQFYRTRMAGFNPLYGKFMMGGGSGAFSDFIGQRPQTVTTSPTTGVTASPYSFVGPANENEWAAAVLASRDLVNPNEATLTDAQIGVQGYLQGENARQNAIAMSLAGMGGGVGMGAAARERALGRLYDLYSARASAQGIAQGGFLDYLSGRLA